MQVEPPLSETPGTWIVMLATDTVPQVDVVYPEFELVVEGGVHPNGTVTLTCPLLTPPAAAVYVKTRVFPVDPLPTTVGATTIVPDPFAANVVTWGDPAVRSVSVPPASDFSCVVNVDAPVDDGAVAPGPPEPLSP